MTDHKEGPSMESTGYTLATLEIIARRSDPPTEIYPYQTSWPQTFAQVAADIESALGSSALRLEHVGSTSVPDLDAKPIIDILLEVSDPSAEGSYVPALEGLGFILHFRQPKWHGHRFLALALEEHGAEINVHVHRAGCQIAAQFLTFRDFLRDNAWAREEYVEAKRKAAETSNGDKGGRVQYQRDKAAVLNRLKARALAESPSPACIHCRAG